MKIYCAQGNEFVRPIKLIWLPKLWSSFKKYSLNLSYFLSLIRKNLRVVWPEVDCNYK